jgi:predicted transcriptional regulator
MLKKETVIQTIEQLGGQFSIDELLDRLIFLNKVEEGLEDIKNGKVLSEDQARERLSKWLSLSVVLRSVDYGR